MTGKVASGQFRSAQEPFQQSSESTFENEASGTHRCIKWERFGF